MTSLAQQLGQLKTQQKDEISLPSRVKISFLFDVKQAANIDDQTLFYICQSGVSALEPVVDLSPFQADILNEKSIQFYRGTETAETLAPIDERLELLIKLLAPHVLESGCHKIIEYLIRIYDIHVHQKTLLINAFLPFFETAFFLRMIQLLSLEKDQEYGFLHSFAYQGSGIDKATLVKCLGRNSGLVFIKYAQFSFSLLDVLLDPTSAGQHWKFFGSMMCEILRAHSGDQNLMFNCLPYISQSLKQPDVRELQISGFMAISQLACRKTLSIEYTQAFIRQTLQTVSKTDVGDDDLRLKGLTVLLFLAMYQSQSMVTLSQKDFKIARRIDDLPHLLQTLSHSYDISGLAKVLILTVVRDSSIDLEQVSPLIGSMTKDHLKTTYILIQAVVFEGIAAENEQKERVQSTLRLLKELQPHEFNQSSIYMLRRLATDPTLKQQVLSVLSGDEQGNLVSTFGDQEYSILNALASAHQPTKLSALQALQNKTFIEGLLPNERGLVKLVLLQTISSPSQQIQPQLPQTLSLTINAIVNITSSKEASSGGSDDVEFECLEALLDAMHCKSSAAAYPQDLKNELASALVNRIKVSQPLNQIKQVWIALCFQLQSKSSKLTQASNAYHGYLQAASLKEKSPSKSKASSKSSPNKSGGGLSLDSLVQAFVAKPIQAVKFLLEIVRATPAYIDYNKISTILLKLGQTTKTNMMRSTFMQQLYIPLLNAFDSRKQLPHADKILASIVSSITPFESASSLQDRGSQMNLTCVNNILKVAVRQKQANPAEFNFQGLLQTLFDVTLAGSKALFCELLVQTAIESECLLTRVFACLQLTKMHDNCCHANQNQQAQANTSSVLDLQLCVSQQTAMSFLLTMLNDESSVVRQQGINFAQAYAKLLGSSGDDGVDQYAVQCFNANSMQTGQSDAGGNKLIAPLKKSISAPVLKTLLKVSLEVIQDRNQLSTTLMKVKNQEVFEHVVRTLADFPTFRSKSKLISVLSLVPQQSLVFAQNLCKVQEKLFSEINEQTQRTGKFELDGLDLLIQVAGLIATQHQSCIKRGEAAPELMVGLILRFITFVTENQSTLLGEMMSTQDYQERIAKLKDIIVSLFENNVLHEACLKDQEDAIVKRIFELYLSLQAGLLKGSNERLKNILIDQANQNRFSGKQLAMILDHASQKVLEASASSDDTQALDVLLETIVQVQFTKSSEKLSLSTEALNVIDRLVTAFCASKKRDTSSLLANDYAFSIELSAQLCLQTLGSYKAAPKVAPQESLSRHLSQILEHIKLVVTETLSNDKVDTHDPFNDFMASKSSKRAKDNQKMRDDNDSEGNSSADEANVDNDLLPSYQILLSLVSLMTKIEVTKSMKVTMTAQLLKDLSNLVLETSVSETRQVIKQKALTQALFQLYQSAVLKTATIATSPSSNHLEEFALRDCLHDYSELVVSLCDGAYEELIKGGRVYLQVLNTAGFSTYAFLSSVILIARATHDLKLKIKETLEIDSSTPKSSGAAIFLLKQVILTSIEAEQSLSTVELLTYTISQVRFSEQINHFLEEKTRLVFSQDNAQNSIRKAINGLSNWINTHLLKDNEKVNRKFLYLGICLLEQWLGTSYEFQTGLARLAGTETPTADIQTQLVNCFLSSYLIAQANTTLLNKDVTSQDKQFKNSLLRLNRNTKKFQQALNEMFSLQIHVEIVLQILNFGDNNEEGMSKKDKLNLIPLKNNCLQLLNEKISSYNQGFLSKASKPLQKVFKRLIARAIELLKLNSGVYKTDSGIVTKGAHLNEVTALNESLMAVLQYTCCGKTLSKSMQTDSLEVVQSYQQIFLDDSLQHKHFLLQTQLTMTEFYLFEAYALSVLEYLPAFFDHVIQGFQKVKQTGSNKSNEQVLFAGSFQSALLKASISITSLFFKFLNAQQLEQLITAVTTTKAASSKVSDESSQVSIVLDTIGLESKMHKKLTIHATFNSYQEVVVQSMGQSVFEKQATRYFGELLCPVLKNLPGKFVQENSKKFITFLKECFTLTHRASKQGSEVSETVQDCIVECFNAFVIKLNEEQLRPCILKITKWAMREKNEQEFNFYKALMLCKLLCGVLETLREFFVPLVAIFFEPAILKIMATLTKLLKHSNSKRSRAELNHEDVPQELSEDLLTSVCRTLQLCFKHDASCYIQSDSFEKLCDPVADLLTLLKVSNFTNNFVERSIKPLCFEMNDRINEDSMWIKLNYAILMKTRSEQWQTRQGALLVIEHLFETMRERYLVVLNDTIPFLSELLEDENEMVETAAKKIVSRVEQMTGESINDYLK